MTREPIWAALFALVSSAPGLITSSRILKHWSDVPSEMRPALYQTQGSETVAATAANGLPSKWSVEGRIYVYVSTDGVTPPGAILNPILDTIEAKLMPNALGTPQTLGGLVEWVRIEGTIETSEGALGQDEVAIIPVRFLTA